MRILGVSEFIEVVNGVLRETLSGEAVAVEGEVSGFRVSQGQWVSFDLKEKDALLNVFLTVWNLRVPVEDGMRVRVFGVPRIYPKYGKFSLSADRIELAGEGALKKALLLLRERLTREGLFDPRRKRLLPRFPRRIALIASRESAAYGDFIRIVSERWGGLEIDVYHVLVQGEKAVADIVGALQQAGQGAYDVVVMTRGGGSLEELMAFNDERLVRAVHASPIPTLVAIGHERDVTLAEEAADVRGSTPTDCARRLIPDRRDVLYELSTYTSTIEQSFRAEREAGARIIDRALAAPQLWLTGWKTRVDRETGRCVLSTERWLEGLDTRLQNAIRLSSSFDPRAVLSRGYALLKDGRGRTVSRTADIRPGAAVKASLVDGEVDLLVTGVSGQNIQPTLL